ncbi:MAG: hypothetical protein CMJ18_09870 [Phycisphaeraceae bacterium]|nr:hypothetical protein [Phycisphaeraceae bacterium]
MDPSKQVRSAALHALAYDCDQCDPDIFEPFVADSDIHDRATALAGLCRHCDGAPRWFLRGLKDPSPHVRLEVARQLHCLDAAEHHDVFEFALTDPNPEIMKRARKLTAHKHYAPLKW